MFEGHWWFRVSPPLLSILLLAQPLFFIFFLILSLLLPLPPPLVEPRHILIQEEKETDKKLHLEENKGRERLSQR